MHDTAVMTISFLLLATVRIPAVGIGLGLLFFFPEIMVMTAMARTS
jgi:hypothetical protein